MGELLEILVELVMELVLDCGLEVSNNKKIPRPIRILALLLFLILCLGGVGILVFLGYNTMQEGKWGAAIFFYLIAGILCVGIIGFFVKAKKEKEKLRGMDNKDGL